MLVLAWDNNTFLDDRTNTLQQIETHLLHDFKALVQDQQNVLE